MSTIPCLLLALLCAPPQDTVRLEVGSPQVNGGMYPPHKARNRVYRGTDSVPVAEWTNELTLGDSAGRRVARWVTIGRRRAADGTEATWELRQTYDAKTLAPYGYHSVQANGGYIRLAFEGTRVRGVRRANASAPEEAVDRTLDQAAFIASASDLVPLAAGLAEGAVMTAPVWGPGMQAPEVRVFTVLGKAPVTVEGTSVTAWKVEERVRAGGRLVATWWLTESSPFMVYAEVALPDGGTQRMSGVALDGGR